MEYYKFKMQENKATGHYRIVRSSAHTTIEVIGHEGKNQWITKIDAIKALRALREAEEQRQHKELNTWVDVEDEYSY